LYSAINFFPPTFLSPDAAMRVSIQILRESGRWIGPDERRALHGDLRTKKFVAGDSLVKVLEFVEVRSAPGMYQLSDPKVKECWAEKSTIVYSGLACEGGAWVAQEWLVDVNPRPSTGGAYPHWGEVNQQPPKETSVGIGWIKPRHRHEPRN